MSQSEPDANQILKNDGTRYMVTDIEMDTAKFWAMATWYNTTIGVTPYQRTYPDPSRRDITRVQGITVLANRITRRWNPNSIISTAQ